MNTNALATAIVAKAAGITAMRGASDTVPDTIPASPWTVLGSNAGTIEGGYRINYTFPLRCYVERTADAGRVAHTVNDLVDAFVAAYRDGLTLSGTVAESRITAWNSDLYAEVGKSEYQVIEFSLLVVLLDMAPHTP